MAESEVIYNHQMSDQPVPDQPVQPQPPPPPEPITEFHIGEEFGTAKRSLPPIGIVLLCLAAVAVIVGIFAFKERPKPQGAGSIDLVAAAEVPGQNMIMAAITFTLRNTTDKPLWIHTSKRISSPPTTRPSTMTPLRPWMSTAIYRRFRL